MIQTCENLSKWDARFMDVANLVGSWSSCLKRNVGCVIVKNKRIISTGYNGAPQQIISCVDLGQCARQNVPSGTRSEICRAVHAEQNALAQAARLGINVDEATLYCTHKPCTTCIKIIINAGIKTVIYEQDYPDDLSDELIKESSLTCIHYIKGNKLK